MVQRNTIIFIFVAGNLRESKNIVGKDEPIFFTFLLKLFVSLNLSSIVANHNLTVVDKLLIHLRIFEFCFSFCFNHSHRITIFQFSLKKSFNFFIFAFLSTQKQKFFVEFYILQLSLDFVFIGCQFWANGREQMGPPHLHHSRHCSWKNNTKKISY